MSYEEDAGIKRLTSIKNGYGFHKHYELFDFFDLPSGIWTELLAFIKSRRVCQINMPVLFMILERLFDVARSSQIEYGADKADGMAFLPEGKLLITYDSPVKERLEGDTAVWMDCYDLD